MKISDGIVADGLQRDIRYRVDRRMYSPSALNRDSYQYRDILTGESFIHKNASEIVIGVYPSVHDYGQCRITTISPEHLTRIRTFLEIEGDGKFLIVSPLNFSEPIVNTLKYLFDTSSNLRSAMSVRSETVSYHEWENYLKITLTDDWCNSVSEFIQSGKFDVKFAIDFVTAIAQPIFNGKPTVYYSVCYSNPPDVRYGDHYRQIVGVCLSSNKQTATNYFQNFESSYKGYGRHPRELEFGSVTFENDREMLDQMSKLMRQWQNSSETMEFTENAAVGLRTWRGRIERFVFPAERHT